VGIGFGFIGRKIGEEIKKHIGLIFEARKDDNRHALLYNSAGEDSVPLDEERLVIIRIDGNGRYAILGVLTPSQGANPGEKIFFSRDRKREPESSIVAKISMLNNGSITIDTDTETTDEATGEFNRVIKGETNITERKDRFYLNEANVTNTIKKNQETTIEGNYNIYVDGDYNLIVKGNVTINGKRIDLN
jgi:hypothetical protein